MNPFSKFFRTKKRKHVKRVKKSKKRDEGTGRPPTPEPDLPPKMVCVCYTQDEVKQKLQEQGSISECEETDMSDVDWEKDTAPDRNDCEVDQLMECQKQCPPALMTKYMSSHSMQMVQEFAEAISQQRLVDDINCYVDELVEVFHRFVDENCYDPFTVKNIQHTDIDSITIFGARSLRRTADAQLYKEDCGTLVADLRGGFKLIRVVADVRRRLCPGMVVRGILRAKFEETEFHVKLRFSANNWMKPTLHKFEVCDWGKVKVAFRGKNWLGSMVRCTTRNVLPNVLTETAKRKLPSFLKAKLQAYLRNITE